MQPFGGISDERDQLRTLDMVISELLLLYTLCASSTSISQWSISYSSSMLASLYFKQKGSGGRKCRVQSGWHGRVRCGTCSREFCSVSLQRRRLRFFCLPRQPPCCLAFAWKEKDLKDFVDVTTNSVLQDSAPKLHN